jgi:hypothetical protein
MAKTKDHADACVLYCQLILVSLWPQGLPPTGASQLGSASNFAIVEVDWSIPGTIGSHNLERKSFSSEPKVVELPPGLHTDEHGEHSFDFELLPGRVYRLKYHKTKRWRRLYYYIEDADSRETIQCYRFSSFASGPTFKPVGATPENKGVVYIYYQMISDYFPMTIAANGKKITTIYTGGYFPNVSAPGMVHFEVIRGTEVITEADVTVEAG